MAETHQNKMVKTARMKFVAGATSAALAAVLLLIISINLVRFIQVRNQQEETLLSLSADRIEDEMREGGTGAYTQGNLAERAVMKQEEKGHIKDVRKGGRESAFMQYSGRFFEITVASDGTMNLHSKNTEAMTEAEAESCVSEILETGKETGYWDDFRYLIQKNADGTTVVSLLDCTEDARSLSDLRMITITVGLSGTLIAFFFILATSKKAIAPLVDSMEKQKRFVTDAGHELKTPLSVIATNMDILTMDLGENEWVEGTKRQVGKLRKLVNNLVYLSKMDEQETTLAAETFSISETALECAELYQSVADAAGKRLESSIEEGLDVTADENSIRQLFSILLDNAIKYAEGDHVIRVSLHREAKKIFFETENDWVKNVDPARLESLFDRFTRGDRSRSNADGKNGFGLGLAIARSVAEKNHATLAASETNEGKLRFTLCMHC